MKALAFAATTIFISLNVMAGNVTVPNVFVPSQPALASEVNDNFTAVEDGVNDNNSRLEYLESFSVTADCGGDSHAVENAVNAAPLHYEVYVNVIGTCSQHADNTISRNKVTIDGGGTAKIYSLIINGGRDITVKNITLRANQTPDPDIAGLSVSNGAEVNLQNVTVENVGGYDFDDAGLKIEGYSQVTSLGGNEIDCFGSNDYLIGIESGSRLIGVEDITLNCGGTWSWGRKPVDCALDSGSLQTTIDSMVAGGAITASGICDPITILNSNISITGPATILGAGSDGQTVFIKGANNIELTDLVIDGNNLADHVLNIGMNGAAILEDVTVQNGMDTAVGVYISSALLLLDGNNISISGGEVYGLSVGEASAVISEGIGNQITATGADATAVDVFGASQFTQEGNGPNSLVINGNVWAGINASLSFDEDATINGGMELNSGASVEACGVTVTDWVRLGDFVSFQADCSTHLNGGVEVNRNSSLNLNDSSTANGLTDHGGSGYVPTDGSSISGPFVCYGYSTGGVHSEALGAPYCGDDDGDGVLNWQDSCMNDGDQGYGVYSNGCPIPAP